MHTLIKMAIGTAIAVAWNKYQNKREKDAAIRASLKRLEDKGRLNIPDLIVTIDPNANVSVPKDDDLDIPEFVQRDQAMRRHPLDPNFKV